MQCDEEIFEINDFSTSSDWERFIADIEEILTQWNLTNSLDNKDSIIINTSSSSSPTTSNSKIATSKLLSEPNRWQHRQESIKYRKVSFSLQFFQFRKDSASSSSVPIGRSSEQCKQQTSNQTINQSWRDMCSIENDWPVTGHPLVRYYGLSQFLLLIPLDGEIIGTEDRARHLLGSASIALHNLDCEIPFFCQISTLSRRLFMGIGHQTNGFRTYFDMIQFPDIPPSYRYFNELMVLFKKKLYSSFSYHSNVITPKDETIDEYRPSSSSSSSNEPTVRVSIRFTYLLNRWPTEYLLFNPSIIDSNLFVRRFSYFGTLNIIPKAHEQIMINFANIFGDPLTQWQLATTWPSVAEELITDNAYHSDLQPRNAPKWSLRSLFNDDPNNLPIYCRYVELIRLFRQLANRSNSNIPLLNSLFQEIDNHQQQQQKDEQDIRQALDRLSTPSSTAQSSLLKTTNKLLVTSQFLTDLMSMVSGTGSRQIPPEYIEAFVENLFDDNDDSNDREKANEKQDNKPDDDQFDKLKSAPRNSLSWRLANLVVNIYGQTRQPINLAQLWKFFIQKLRNHWRSGQLLPHLYDKNNEIDHGSCLFHQKLQMLNSCIRQKIKREHQNIKLTVAAEDSDEEFFDAQDEELETETENQTAEGQLYPLKDSNDQPIYLLSNSNRPIQVPQTQDPAPMTEDILARQVANLAQIDDVRMKIRLQSAGLLSDMEAFKAANPGCQFEDFIRWHSPRDWIQQQSSFESNKVDDMPETFGLSRRMRESNTWNELWQSARACPVRRQKRLFNYTKEAEEILQYFETISLKTLVDFLSPIVFKSLIVQLLRYRREILDFIRSNNNTGGDDSNIDFLSIDIISIEHLFNRNDYSQLIDEQLNDLEFSMLKFYSLLHKFCHSYESVFQRQKKLFANLFREQQPQQRSNSPTAITGKITSTKKLPATRLSKSNNMKTLTELKGSDFIQFILKLINEPEVEFANTDMIAELIVKIFADSDRFQYEQSTSVGDRIRTNELSSSDNEKMMKIISSGSLPPPTGKEFIIRATGFARPAPYSRPSSNRMYCFLSKDFRIASAFTEDIAYF